MQINERLFDNGSTRQPVPLLSLVAASNELPQSEELDALYDRFLIRHENIIGWSATSPLPKPVQSPLQFGLHHCMQEGSEATVPTRCSKSVI
jgi:hypothetical protein